MKGSAKVVAMLNELLTGELSAADGYLLQARMLEDWGYRRLAERLAHEAEDERHHADSLIKRILFLEGAPDLGRRLPVKIAANPEEMMTGGVAAETVVRDALKAGIRLCLDEGDAVSRKLLEKLLEETEHDHMLWFETQVRLCKALGRQAWLAEQI